MKNQRTYSPKEISAASRAHRRGNPRRLDQDQVREIRRRYVEEGCTIAALASEFRASPAVIFKALHGIGPYRDL